MRPRAIGLAGVVVHDDTPPSVAVPGILHEAAPCTTAVFFNPSILD